MRDIEAGHTLGPREDRHAQEGPGSRQDHAFTGVVVNARLVGDGVPSFQSTTNQGPTVLCLWNRRRDRLFALLNFRGRWKNDTVVATEQSQCGFTYRCENRVSVEPGCDLPSLIQDTVEAICQR